MTSSAGQESVRLASHADVANLKRLRHEHVAETVQLRGGALLEAELPVPDWVALIAGSDSCVWLGCLDSVVVAYALVQRSEVAGLARIAELFVEHAARSVGIGELLRGACVTTARDWGCSGLDAFALPGARETKNFFEAGGFKARLLVVHRSLD